VAEACQNFAPDAVVHLAARTDMDGQSVEAYAVNRLGTLSVIEAARRQPSIERLFLVSSQFVHQNEQGPAHDEDYAPHTCYGASKVESERLIRGANLHCHWTIIRPTNVWGPWHPRYPDEVWRIIRRGLYFHPGRKPVIRSYGYVGNVVFQMIKMLKAPAETVDRKVFYVGDEPIDVFNWVEGFAQCLNGRGVRVAPRPFVWSLALTGEVCKCLGVPAPLTLSRYRSMVTDNPAPMAATFAAFGSPPYRLQAAIEETVLWLRRQDPEFWGPPTSHGSPKRHCSPSAKH
jgi:nucleoside-diphosphate-sugar epimerase